MKKIFSEFLNNKLKWRQNKIIIPSLLSVLLIVLMLGGYILPKYLLGSVYSISEIENNIDKVKVGDTINYELNGYSDWQVISVDKKNNKFEMVSKTNVDSIMLKGGRDSDFYLNTLQSVANEFYDNKYVTNVRSVNISDLDKFDYDSDFWTSDIEDNIIKTSMSSWADDLYTSDIYLIPSTLYSKNHGECYRDTKSYGDYCDISIIGINGWIYISDSSYAAWGDYKSSVVPTVPIKIVIDDEDYDINQYVYDFLNSFPQSMGGSRGWNYISNNSDLNKLHDLFSDFFDSQENDVIFYLGKGDDGNCYKTENGNEIMCNSYLRYSVENGSFSYSSGSIYQANKVTKGFRPVVTISLDKREKELDTRLKVGDNVKYSLNGYNNWKVISINEDNNTAEVISGGVMKNILLRGDEDYNSYEEILQREISQYQEDGILGVRMVEKSDISVLNQIDDKVLASYFVNNKGEYTGDTYPLEKSGSATIVAKYVSTLSFDKMKNNNILKQSILVVDLSGDEDAVYYYINSYYPPLGFDSDGLNYPVGIFSCMSGIRPILTLKLNEIEKMTDEEEINNVEVSSGNIDSRIYNEQTNYNGNSSSSSRYEKSNGNSDSSSKNEIINGKTDVDSNVINDDSVSNSNIENMEPDTTKNDDNKLILHYTFIIVFSLLIIVIVIAIVYYSTKYDKDVNKK